MEGTSGDSLITGDSSMPIRHARSAVTRLLVLFESWSAWRRPAADLIHQAMQGPLPHEDGRRLAPCDS